VKILLVDDDPDLLAVTGFALQQAGFLVVKASDGLQALQQVEAEQPDLMVLDINMPRMNGFEVVRRLRADSAMPVLALTVRSEDDDVVRMLESGADDYLTKPFSPRVLVSRVKALLRRVGLESAGAITVGGLSLKMDDLVLEGLPQGSVRLTPLEARFLQLLMVNGGRTVPAQRILVHVWGRRAGGDRQLLKQLVHRLRHKIEENPAEPRLLRTVPNAGYALDSGEEAPEQAKVAPPSSS
jgi:DNA-binding response OmpR family regulator